MCGNDARFNHCDYCHVVLTGEDLLPVRTTLYESLLSLNLCRVIVQQLHFKLAVCVFVCVCVCVLKLSRSVKNQVRLLS